MALLLAPAVAQTTQNNKALRSSAAMSARPVGAFTPAVSDPRLAAELARRGTRLTSEFRFTPAAASTERSRAVRVAVRAHANTPPEAANNVTASSAAPVTAKPRSPGPAPCRLRAVELKSVTKPPHSRPLAWSLRDHRRAQRA